MNKPELVPMAWLSSDSSSPSASSHQPLCPRNSQLMNFPNAVVVILCCSLLLGAMGWVQALVKCSAAVVAWEQNCVEL